MKPKLTEEQLREGVFEKILKSILKGRTKNVLKILKDNPALQQAEKETSEALDDLEKSLKNAGY
jgi:predicted transcriptional regulator